MSLHVLVVDDDAMVCEAIEMRLSSLGRSVTCADGGLEAVELVTHKVFDLVITDILMPTLDGLELISQLRRSQPDVRIVAMSGGGRLSRSFCLDNAKDLGAHAVLAKPFSFSELAFAIGSVAESTPESASNPSE